MCASCFFPRQKSLLRATRSPAPTSLPETFLSLPFFLRSPRKSSQFRSRARHSRQTFQKTSTASSASCWTGGATAAALQPLDPGGLPPAYAPGRAYGILYQGRRSAIQGLREFLQRDCFIFLTPSVSRYHRLVGSPRPPALASLRIQSCCTALVLGVRVLRISPRVSPITRNVIPSSAPRAPAWGPPHTATSFPGIPFRQRTGVRGSRVLSFRIGCVVQFVSTRCSCRRVACLACVSRAFLCFCVLAA